MSVLRTPDARFHNLPGYDFAAHYIDIGDTRMHYVDEGEGAETILCLHGEPTWSYLYRRMIPPLADRHRVLAPDMVGFGKSDKYAALDDYSFHLHYDKLVGLVEALDLTNITLVCQDWGGSLGLTIAANHGDRFARLVVLNTFLPTGEEKISEAFMQWRAFSQKVGRRMQVGRLVAQTISSYELPADVIAAYDAPFPDDSYKAGAAVFPSLAPIAPEMAGAAEMKAARAALSRWRKPAQVMFSDGDPILGGAANFFRRLLPTAGDQPEITIRGAGHFLQEEKGEEIAGHVLAFIERTPAN
ncbi:MAG: haloalkane dehalogenase [Chloroflexota bacterium]|nr:haloalkane dehalogenase [Chloroflexota bacterium]MDE2948255.1 haloalkane dehalogenase [Chloroflexota bacterium]